MTFLELFMLIASGARIFALIGWVFLVYNGRMTRREISKLIAAESEKTREMIQNMSKMIEKLSELIVTEGDKTRELIKVLKG